MRCPAVLGGVKGVFRSWGRSLDSSTFWLNVSAPCGMGGYVQGLFRGFLADVRRYEGAFTVYFVSETVQVEPKSGRV
jgi:hypothetical protein